MSALIWNCQGAAQGKFHSVLKSLIKDQKISLLVLVEPRVSGRSADKVIKRLGFPNSFRIEASGFSGGIWLLWSDRVRVEILHAEWQFIHTKIHMIDADKSFLFTPVYANPTPSICKHLWSSLLNLSYTISEPWAIAGDFNAVLSSSERKTSSSALRAGCHDFQAFVQNCSLMDSSFSGPRFTWRRGLSIARLDRVLLNQIWATHFPYSSTTHLPKLASNHRPLKFDLGLTQAHPNSPPPFRFLAAWLSEPTFKDLIHNI